MTAFEAKVPTSPVRSTKRQKGRVQTTCRATVRALADARGAHSMRQQFVNDIERETRTTGGGRAAAQARNALNELIQQAGCQTTEQLELKEGSQKAKPQ